MTVHKTFTLKSEARPTFHDITDKVHQLIDESGIREGMVLVFSQHTTCSVMIQEQSDDVDYYGTQYVLQDLVNVLDKIIPTCRTEGDYLHPGPKHIEIAGRERQEEPWWSLNTDAHLRSVIMGRSETIPVSEGKMVLGEFGRIYFADFDQVRARKRIVNVQIMGDKA